MPYTRAMQQCLFMDIKPGQKKIIAYTLNCERPGVLTRIYLFNFINLINYTTLISFCYNIRLATFYFCSSLYVGILLCLHTLPSCLHLYHFGSYRILIGVNI